MDTLILSDEIIRDREGRNISVWWSMLAGRVFRVEFAAAPHWTASETVDLLEVA